MTMLERERHEELLNELLDGDLETSRRTEVLQMLRVDHSTATQSISEMTEAQAKLQATHDDLVVSNSRLFRQLGTGSDEGKKEELDEKEFSETVTITQLEGGQ